MKKHFFSFAAIAVVMAMAFTACKKNDSVNNDNNGGQTVAVTGVTLNQTTATLVLTDSPLTLVATVAPANATNKTVSWASSNSAVATVAGGVVTPLTAGTATITATTQDGGMIATCAVTVSVPNVAVTGVTLSQTSATLLTTDPPLTLTATVAPDNATVKTVSWTSSNAAVATVAGGVVTPLAAGTTNITVTTQDGNMTASCAVTVTPDPLTYDAGMVIGGLKWATRNVGAPHTFVANPEDPGMYYQWNSATGWSATDPLVSSPVGATWNSSWDGGGAAATSWTTANDPCPAGWRMPTNDEFNTLVNAGSGWTTTPAPGRVFGSGSNTVFFPATGSRLSSSGALSSVGSIGYYWPATPLSATAGYALYFNSGSVYPGGNYSRASGFAARCVAK